MNKSDLTLSVKLTFPVTTVVRTISSVVRFVGLAHWTSEISFIMRGLTEGPVITTIDAGRPLDIGLRGERVVSLAGQCHIPLVEVILEPALSVDHSRSQI